MGRKRHPRAENFKYHKVWVSLSPSTKIAQPTFRASGSLQSPYKINFPELPQLHLHCFSEDRGGNFISFWAELHNVDTKEAYKQILEKYGKLTEPDPKKNKPAKPKNKSLQSPYKINFPALPQLHLNSLSP